MTCNRCLPEQLSNVSGSSLILLTTVILLIAGYCPRNAYSTTAAPQTNNLVLEPGRPIERTLAGDESHSYEVKLAAGQFCHVVVEQRGIDVIVSFYGPSGDKLVEIDNPNDIEGPESLSLLPRVSGTYRLEVRSPQKNAPVGKYEVKLEELRAQIPQDETRIAAQTAYTEAKAFRNRRTEQDFRTAIENYQKALTLWQTLGDRLMQAYSLHEMGLIYGDLGEYQKSLDSNTQALTLYKALNTIRQQAGVLNNIGWIYSTLGEHKNAIDYYEASLDASRSIGDRYSEPVKLSNIGAEYASVGLYQKALDTHLQVLAMRRSRGDQGGQAITLNNIANCYEHLGKEQQALNYYLQALELMPALANVFYTAATLNNIGALQLKSGNSEKALEYLQQALRLRRTIGDRKGEAATLFNIAQLERDRGNLAESRNRVEEALTNVESLRVNVNSQQLRASFVASVRDYYEFDVNVLMRLHKLHPADGYDALALQVSEKARARSLLELLTEAGGEIKQGVDPILIEREHTVRQSIADMADRQMRLLSRSHTDAQATAAAKVIDKMTAEYEQIQAQIREKSPRYAALVQPTPLNLKQIQSQVLDEDSVVLEYALGAEKSFMWAVSSTSIKSFELPKSADIDKAARRVFELLTARNQTRENQTLEGRREVVQQADVDYLRAAATLSQMLLGPVATDIKGKRLVIVAEGVLQYLPFGALPEPLANGTPKDGLTSAQANSKFQPLVVEHEIVNLPSASVLAVLRQETNGRTPPEKTLAVFADPVFASDDPRVSSAGRRPVNALRSPASEFRKTVTESGVPELARLRFSRLEADQISRLAAKHDTLEAVDFAANRVTATNPDMAEYRILHFATHGLINSQHPELSGVVLSLVDVDGRPQDGFLRLYDIYNLKLRAELVVLSACQTALGKDIRGEGLVGLTRGFMYAGAPRVVASLWQIDDRASAEFMQRFYEGILRQGLRPAAALQAAQISMSRDRRWSSPYYWAAFTLQGEWK